MKKLCILKKAVLAAAIVAILAAGSTVGSKASTVYSNDFSSTAEGWTNTGAVGEWGVESGEYMGNGYYGGGALFSMRDDVAVPSSWVYETDLRWVLSGWSWGDTNYGNAGLVISNSATDPGNSQYMYFGIERKTDGAGVTQSIYVSDSSSHIWNSASFQPTSAAYHLKAERVNGNNYVTVTVTGGTDSFSVQTDDVPYIDQLTKVGANVYFSKWGFDNLSLTTTSGPAPVPEPSGTLALVTGMAGLVGGFVRRRL